MVGFDRSRHSLNKPAQAGSLERRKQTGLLPHCVPEPRRKLGYAICFDDFFVVHTCLDRVFSVAYTSRGDSKTIINQIGIEISARTSRLTIAFWLLADGTDKAPVTIASTSGPEIVRYASVRTDAVTGTVEPRESSINEL